MRFLGPDDVVLPSEARHVQLVNIKAALVDKAQEALEAEQELFTLRDGVEVLWINIGQVMSDIVDRKLYTYRQDEHGNYFRTAKGYFEYLDRKFAERGWSLSRSTLYRFADDYRLFVKALGMSAEECATLGKSTLQRLAPGVRRLLDAGQESEARELVQEVLVAVENNGGLPATEVDIAVDDATGRVMKSLEVTFEERAVGYRMKSLTLWWGGLPLNLLTQQVTDEQAAWIAKRLGNKFSEKAPD